MCDFFSRQGNEKDCVLCLVAADGNAAAQILRQPLDNGKPQTVTLYGTAAFFTSVETVKHVEQRLRRDDRPAVAYLQPNLPLGGGQPDGYTATGRPVLDGVLHQTGGDAL